MALPDYLVGLANNFVTQYGNQIFDPATGQVRGLPGNVQQQTAPMTLEQWQGLYGITANTPGAQNVANTAANQATGTLQGQYLPGSGWLDPGLQNLGVGQTAATMGGAYLNPATNPYLAGTFQSAAAPMINAYQTATSPGNFAAAQRAGQFGSTAMNEQGQLNQFGLGQNLASLGNQIYGGAYQQERGIQANTTNQVQQSQNAAFQNERARQLQALSMAPSTAQGLYAPSQALYGGGSQVQQQQQTQMDTGYSNAVANYESPFNQLTGYGNALLTAGGGGTTAQTQTKSGSLLCTALYDRGITDADTYAACSEFGRRTNKHIFRGYQLWARPLAWAMRRSKLVTFILLPFARAWQREMAARVNGGRGSLLGKIILAVGMPLCGLLWRVRSSIRILFRQTCPATIRFSVRPVVIWKAIDRFSFRRFAHIFEKIFEASSFVFIPAIADGNTSASIVFKRLVFRIAATRIHSRPAGIGSRRSMSARVTMSETPGVSLSDFHAAATTGFTEALAKITCVNRFFRTATTTAKPQSVAEVSNDKPVSENLPSEVD